MKKRDETLHVRTKWQTKAKLQKYADAEGRKLSNYVDRVLEAHVAQRERAEKARQSGGDEES